ncbi:MAG: thioredoxin-like domain-containing protein [Planctomycetota bacterium]
MPNEQQTSVRARLARSLRRALAVGLAAAVIGVAGWLMPTSEASAQIRAPELEPNRGWLNTDRPLRIHEELEGHVVLLDFWTYCCINCLHILPDLEYLEEKYADEPFVVVGVHSAKFDTEAERRSIRNAMFRYDIKHPVVVDDEFRIWRSYGARAWPTFAVVAPDGEVVGITSGEGKRELLDEVIGRLLDESREDGTLAEQRVEFELDEMPQPASGLRYPGKILAVPAEGDAPGRLFVADSSNDRVIVAEWPDDDGRSRVIDVYGDGVRGSLDGGPVGSGETARFNDPQGFAFDAEQNLLYVADTKNHLIRTIDLNSRRVETLVGTGIQGYDRRGGKKGTKQSISSPWALALDKKRGRLYVAIAGLHQLWTVELDNLKTKVFAGNGRESVVDGPARDAELAQPSGFAFSSDGDTLYFTDTEGSAVRAVDLDEETVRTIIGITAEELSPAASPLFEFGDIDGGYPDARLQHAIGITLRPTPDGDRLVIADTYNDKIKIIDPEARMLYSWLGADRAAPPRPGELRFEEPAGLSHADGAVFVADTNKHRVVRIDAETGRWREVFFEGLPVAGATDERRIPTDAARVAASLEADVLTLEPELPGGYKLNAELPLSLRISRIEAGRIAETLEQRTIPAGSVDALPVTVRVPGAEARTEDRPGAELLIELSFAYCTDDESLCIPADLSWIVTPKEGAETTLTAQLDPL